MWNPWAPQHWQRLAVGGKLSTQEPFSNSDVCGSKRVGPADASAGNWFQTAWKGAYLKWDVGSQEPGLWEGLRPSSGVGQGMGRRWLGMPGNTMGLLGHDTPRS